MKTLGKLYRRDRHISRLILMLILWLAFMAITCFDKFFTIKNFQKIASAFPEYGLMALGAMVCMITGGIDLSSVGIANLTGIAMATFMKGQVNEAGDPADSGDARRKPAAHRHIDGHHQRQGRQRYPRGVFRTDQ